MVRPNGSVIGRDSDAGSVATVSVISDVPLAPWPHQQETVRQPNLGTLQSLHNPQLAWCSASN
jgi:hypothetical protein